MKHNTQVLSPLSNPVVKIRKVSSVAFALIAIMMVALSCSEDDKPQPACIVNTETEIFVGEILKLSSCTQNALDYKWYIQYGQFSDFRTGQTVDYVIPYDAVGKVKITLTTSDANGTSEIDYSLQVKSSLQGEITETGVFQFGDVEAVQLPNKGFLLYATGAKANSYEQYQYIVDQSFSKTKSTLIESAKLVGGIDLLSTTEGIYLSGSNSSSYTATSFLDFEGSTIWAKAKYPGLDPAKQYSGRARLAPAIDFGTIMAHDMISANDQDDINDIYLYRFLGQGVSWFVKFSHASRSVVKGITANSDQYIVLTKDDNTGQVFIDAIDKSGKIVLQKELAITTKERSYTDASILYADNKYAITLFKDNATKFYLLDNNFNVTSEVSISSPVNSGIEKTTDGYLLFGQAGTMSKIDSNGNVIFTTMFAPTDSNLEDVIKDTDSNYVLIVTSGDRKKINFIRVSSQGKVIK